MQTPHLLTQARLPQWLLPSSWPHSNGQPALADIGMQAGRIAWVAPHNATNLQATGAVHLHGAPVLPGLVEAHTHLDKTFTLPRIGTVKPGLLAAIEAISLDSRQWTASDVFDRANQALQWAYESGVTHLRTHCDWRDSSTSAPLAWPVLGELAQQWRGKITLERVNITPLTLYTHHADAMALAQQVAASGPEARLGGFVHSTNWNEQALRHLLQAARQYGLDVDLHADEELNPAAQGLATTAALMKELQFEGRVVCGHTCALAAQGTAQALATLDAVAQLPITLITLPMANLLLQDAVTGVTPRQRGVTLVQEARARGIPVLIASDNVQDPFCAVGSYDPLEAFSAGVLAAQLSPAFDVWTEALCRPDWLVHGAPCLPFQVGAPADLLVFTAASSLGFPSRHHPRVVLRAGQVAQGNWPATFTTSTPITP